MGLEKDDGKKGEVKRVYEIDWGIGVWVGMLRLIEGGKVKWEEDFYWVNG